MLFTAHFTDYQTGLTCLSKVMTFFPANTNFLAAKARAYVDRVSPSVAPTE